jgi:hypothetical protein
LTLSRAPIILDVIVSFIVVLLIVLGGCFTPALAQERPVASAVRVTEPPTIDGLLDDEAWQNGQPVAGFIQAEPFEGQPASESTEVRIVYDDDAIYVGVTLYDADPSQIVTTDSRRDAGLEEMDSGHSRHLP